MKKAPVPKDASASRRRGPKPPDPVEPSKTASSVPRWLPPLGAFLVGLILNYTVVALEPRLQRFEVEGEPRQQIPILNRHRVDEIRSVRHDLPV